MVLSELEREAEKGGYFPSDTELRKRGRYDLVSAVEKLQLAWADLQAKSKYKPRDSLVHRGLFYERYTKARLEREGHQVEHTDFKCPYDLLVDGILKLEVKGRRKHKTTNQWMIDFGFDGYTRDIHCAVIYTLPTKPVKLDDFYRVYVIPASRLKQQCVTITDASSWKPYIDNWKLIDTMISALRQGKDIEGLT